MNTFADEPIIAQTAEPGMIESDTYFSSSRYIFETPKQTPKGCFPSFVV
jgi:hypothetical protein